MHSKYYLLLAFLYVTLHTQAQVKPQYFIFIPNQPYISHYSDALYHIKTFEEELKTIDRTNKVQYIAVETRKKYFNETIRDFTQSNIQLDSGYNEIGRFTISIIKQAGLDKQFNNYKYWQYWDAKAQKLTKNINATYYNNYYNKKGFFNKTTTYQIIGDSVICTTEKTNPNPENIWCKYFSPKGILIREAYNSDSKCLYNYAADSLVALTQGIKPCYLKKNTYKFNLAGKPLLITEQQDAEADIDTVSYDYYSDNKLKSAIIQHRGVILNAIDYSYNAKGQVSTVTNIRSIDQEESGAEKTNTAKIVSQFTYLDNGLLSNVKSVFYYNNSTVANPFENIDYTYDTAFRLSQKVAIRWHYKYFDPTHGSWQERDIIEITYKKVAN